MTDEIANTAVWLCSDAATFITDQALASVVTEAHALHLERFPAADQGFICTNDAPLARLGGPPPGGIDSVLRPSAPDAHQAELR